MPRKMPGRKSITGIFTDKEYEQVQTLAAKKNTSMNEIVRDFVIQGLNGTITQNNADFLAPIIREQLTSIINPAVERLAALSAKTCVQSGVAAYLSAEAILKFVPDEEKEEVAKTYEAARKKAVIYMSGKADLD